MYPSAADAAGFLPFRNQMRFLPVGTLCHSLEYVGNRNEVACHFCV